MLYFQRIIERTGRAVGGPRQLLARWRELAAAGFMFGLVWPVVFAFCALLSLGYTLWWMARDEYRDWRDAA